MEVSVLEDWDVEFSSITSSIPTRSTELELAASIYSADLIDNTDAGTKPSAMQNPVILAALFKICPVKLLSKFRLVSRLWHKESLPFWRSTACVVFGKDVFSSGPSDSSIRFWSDSLSADCTLQKFCDFVNNPVNHYCEELPYTWFCLRDWEFSANLNRSVMEQFWLTCCNKITTLELRWCYFEEVHDFRKVIFSCPNLGRLVVDSYNYSSEKDDDLQTHGTLSKLKSLTLDMNYKKFPLSWIELFSHSPGLINLTITRPLFTNAGIGLFAAIKQLRAEDTRNLVLRHLHLDAHEGNNLSADMETLFAELQLSLETLTIRFRADTPIDVAQRNLEMHARTIRILKVYGGPAVIPYNRFPCGVELKSLEELHLSDKLSSNMEFIKLTPNLHVLQIRNPTNRRPPYEATKIIYDTWEPELSNVSLVHLTELRIEYIVREDDLLSLMKWMPNVSKLRMVLTDNQLSIVCGNKSWRKMSNLHVDGSEVTDEGIIGIRFYEEEGVKRAYSSCRPNITMLTGLQSFVMTTRTRNMKPSQLTDLSAFHAFLKLESLEDLRVRVQMGDKAKYALRRKILHCELMD